MINGQTGVHDCIPKFFRHIVWDNCVFEGNIDRIALEDVMFRGLPRAFAAISGNPYALWPITPIYVTKSTLQKMSAELLSVFLKIYISAIVEDGGWWASV